MLPGVNNLLKQNRAWKPDLLPLDPSQPSHHGFLSLVICVSNSWPLLKQEAALVLRIRHRKGVELLGLLPSVRFAEGGKHEARSGKMAYKFIRSSADQMG